MGLEPGTSPRAALVAVDGRSYPLESARLSVRAEGGLAATTLTQRFVNPHAESLEATYTLPLPADGAVLGYTVRVGDTVIRAVVEPRERAEQSYREALEAGRTAGLLEQDRADTFQQRLGHIPPRTPVEVEIAVLQPLGFLAALDGETPRWEFRFPTVVGVRYTGETGRVADAPRLGPDRGADGGIPARIELDALIVDGGDLPPAVTSPSHAVGLARTPDGTRVHFDASERLDRDIVLRWTAAAPELCVRLVEGRGLEGDDGRYGLVTLTPPATIRVAYPRDLTVLLDASGSMAGQPFDLARQVVGELIRSLRPEDRFEILAFADRTVSLTRGMKDATERGMDAALAALAELRCGGGTEMLLAIERALVPLRPDSQHQVVLVTDGQIGFEPELLARLRGGLPAGCRAHAVGIGSAPNRTLMNGVARAGRGIEVMASDRETAREATRRLLAATVQPVLTEIEVTGTAVRESAPTRPADVLAGQPLRLTVELAPEGGVLRVAGRLAGTRETWIAQLTVPAAGVASAPAASTLPLGALHGREAIADLELEWDGRGVDSGLDQRIERRAMRHRIVSRRTSMVAISEIAAAEPGMPPRRERLAVELPAGVSAEGAGLLVGRPGVDRLARVAMMVEPRGLLRGMWRADPRHRVALGRATVSETPPSTLPVRARVSHLGDTLLILEFESPFDGFELFETVWVVGVPGGRAVAFVDERKGDPGGPHPAGARLRLALRIAPPHRWPRDHEVRIECQQRERVVVPAAGIPELVVLEVTLTAPAARRET